MSAVLEQEAAKGRALDPALDAGTTTGTADADANSRTGSWLDRLGEQGAVLGACMDHAIFCDTGSQNWAAEHLVIAVLGCRFVGAHLNGSLSFNSHIAILNNPAYAARRWRLLVSLQRQHSQPRPRLLLRLRLWQLHGQHGRLSFRICCWRLHGRLHG